MPNFICRITGEDGRIVARAVRASSRRECKSSLETEGWLVLSVTRDWKRLHFPSLRIGHKIKDKEFILFNQELVALLKSGYPILRSLEVIAARIKNVDLKELILKIAESVKSGKALSEAFLPYEGRFSKVYIASLMAGEKSGNLPGALTRYTQYAKVIAQTRSRIRSALTYPTVLVLFSFIVVNVLVYFILPRFADFYQDFEAQLPGITKLLMAVSLAVRRHWYFFFSLLVLLVFIYFWIISRAGLRLRLDKFKLRIPFARAILLESGISLFSRTLGILLEAGISLLSAIGIAIQAVPNTFLVHKMRNLPELIKNGQSLSDSLAQADVFPLLALDMIRIGETSANLQGMLGDAADFYDERIRGRIDTLISLIEPIVIIVMGLVAAGILLSVYLPIFNVIQITR